MLWMKHRKIIEALCLPLKNVFPVVISVCRCTFVVDDAVFVRFLRQSLFNNLIESEDFAFFAEEIMLQLLWKTLREC